MKAFMDQDFLLETETAKMLYHDYAAKMPVLDYHCHISPQEIALPRYGWEVTITNGVRCVRMESKSAILPEMRPIGRNSRNGQRHWSARSETRCITGVIWSCSVISDIMAH